MAARQIHRRLLSLFSTKPLQTSPSTEFWRLHLPSTSSYGVTRTQSWQRKIQTLTGPTEQTVSNDVKKNEDSTLTTNTTNSTIEALANASTNENPSVNYKATSSLKVSPRHDLAMIFTCTVCETRSMKTMCRESYEKGVVVARCGGCNNLHLIADHLGMFGKPGSVEELLAARGEEVKRGSVDTLNLTLDDLAGKIGK